MICLQNNIENSSCALYKTRGKFPDFAALITEQAHYTFHFLSLLPANSGKFGAWDTAGCKEITSSNGRKDCECRQLGHFGILFVS